MVKLITNRFILTVCLILSLYTSTTFAEDAEGVKGKASLRVHLDENGKLLSASQVDKHAASIPRAALRQYEEPVIIESQVPNGGKMVVAGSLFRAMVTARKNPHQTGIEAVCNIHSHPHQE